MHMADALVSTPVAIVAGLSSLALIAVSGKEIKKEERPNIIPLMGVMGAFVFAAQMINFSIPGTGSSGHIVGGVLLASLLGPWAAFLTLVSVLIIQCLVFADGGLLALGCNIVNMGAMTCLIAYPFIFRPLIKFPASSLRIILVSIISCVIGLELGALAVTVETELSGVTALPFAGFLGFMGGIHLLIGIGEGLATSAVLIFVQRARPSLLLPYSTPTSRKDKMSSKKFLILFGVLALILGGFICFYASSNPDGLEWSIQKMTGEPELSTVVSEMAPEAASVQDKTAVLPDYENSFSGILGGLATLILVWIFGTLVMTRKRNRK